jgi:hypothetical protein
MLRYSFLLLLVSTATVRADQLFENVKLFHSICLGDAYNFREVPLLPPARDLLELDPHQFPDLSANITEGEVGLWLLKRPGDDAVFISIGMDETAGIASCQIVLGTDEPSDLAAEFHRYLAFEPVDAGPREFFYRERLKYERDSQEWLVTLTYSLEPNANTFQASSLREVGNLNVE